MASQPPPPHSTPIHPRLAELAASSQATGSPFSTPDSVVTASSYDKTAFTPGIASDADTSTDANSSGESLGIRAARPGSSGFIDAQESPPPRSESDTSRNTATTSMTGKSEVHTMNQDASNSSLTPAIASSPDALALQLARSTLAGPDQPDGDCKENQLEAEQPGTAVSSSDHHRIKDISKDNHFISGSTARAGVAAANFYSPPPPLQGAFLKRSGGDYYPENASIPSPKLESIPEVSGEVSKHKATMIETPLRHDSGLRQSALAGRRATPYASSLLQDMLDTSNSLTDSSGKLSTPNNRSGASFNDSMFESPLLAPMAPYGSPIRFSTTGSILPPALPQAPSSVIKSPASLPLSKRLTIRRPPTLDAPSPLKREEAKIRDILWNSPAQDEDDPASADILPPEIEQLGPPSPYTLQFNKGVNTKDGAKNIDEVQSQEQKKNDNHDPAKPPGLKRMHSQPGPNGNLNKIPTLVGPNSLPYARCPSGIDSFAFDLQNPRPYDVVMPIVHDTKIPKSISCDDKLLYRATRDTAVAGEELTEIAPLAAPDIPSQSEQPKMVQTAHWTSHGGTSTHNERARQRMERVRLATMKREQARLEEQNRKEVARITRKLIAEQEQREAAMSREAANRHHQLNSFAVPFMPKAFHHGGEGSVAEPAMLPGFAHQDTRGLVQTLSQPYQPVHFPNNSATFSNIAEASQTQNRLLHILQQRMQGSFVHPSDMPLAQQNGSISPLHNGVIRDPYGLSERHATYPPQGSGVLSAINTMMHTNQQLIAMLQETERVLATAPAIPTASSMHLPPGFHHSQQQKARHTGVTQSKHTSADYRFPGTSQSGTYERAREASEPSFRPNVSASDDPAVLQYQRRKSVTFEDLNLDDRGASTKFPPQTQASMKPKSAPARVIHALPLRPAEIGISQKLLGILDCDDRVSHSPNNIASAKITQPQLADSTSTISPMEADARRANRSNAPSPEVYVAPRVLQSRGQQGQPLTAIRSSIASQSKQRSTQQPKEPLPPKRQPMADKSANLSITSVGSSKSSQPQRQRTDGKENGRPDGNLREKHNNQGPGKHDKVTRKAGHPDDQKWTSFVREMGGVAQAPASK